MAVQTTAADRHLRSNAPMGNLSALESYSINLWIKANWNTGIRMSMVGLYGGATDIPQSPPITGIQIGSSLGNDDLSCWTWGGNVMVGTATGFMTAYNNTWTFITYTYDGTTHKVYLNSVLAASSTTAQTPGILNQVYINGFPGGGTNEVSAYQIDRYALFRKTLSQDEITTIYNSRGWRHAIIYKAICRYEFDELGEGTPCPLAVDYTGNGHQLTTEGAGATMTHTYINNIGKSNTRVVQ